MLRDNIPANCPECSEKLFYTDRSKPKISIWCYLFILIGIISTGLWIWIASFFSHYMTGRGVIVGLYYGWPLALFCIIASFIKKNMKAKCRKCNWHQTFKVKPKTNFWKLD